MQLKYVLCCLVWQIHSCSELCSKQAECNNSDQIRCGICVTVFDQSLGKSSTCIFPFTSVYEPDKSCVQVTSCANNCGGNGECKRSISIDYLDYLPTCQCNEHFYGWTCQHSATRDVSNIVFRYMKVPLNRVKNAVKSTSEYLSLLCGSEESESQGYLEVVSGDCGHYQRIPINRALCKSDKATVQYWYSTRYRYISPKDDNRNNKVKTLDDEVLGYLSSLKITVVIGGIVNYQHEFPVFVSYRESDLICVPVVKLPGCASMKSEEGTTTRRRRVKIESQVSFVDNGKYYSKSGLNPDCGIPQEYTYHWRVWKNEDSDLDTTYLTYHGQKDIEFLPFHLEISNYRILLEVGSIQDNPSINYVYCYLNVKFEPLVAIIDGGSERTIRKHLGLILKTTRSTDPNMPSHDQGHMKASWSCVDVSNQNSEICDPLIVLPVSNSHFVASEKLNFNATLKVVLKVWTDYYGKCESCGYVQPAIASARILIVNQSTSGDDDFYIECLLNCKVKVVNNEQLFLKLKTRSGLLTENYVWSYYEVEQGKEGNINTIAVQGLPSFMLLIKPHAFIAGKCYTIVVTNEEATLLAKYAFETVNLTFQGNCSINPTNGKRGVSTFNILCENFASSFLFEFFDKTKEEAEEGRVFSGRMLGSSNSGELRNFRVTRGNVFVYIKDDSGLYTHKQFIVSLSNWDVNEDILDSVYNNMSESKERNDVAKLIEYISIIPDIVPAEFNKSNILERLLHYVIDFPTDTVSNVKITSSTLTNMVLALNKPVYLKVGIDLLSTVVNVIQKQAELLSSTLGAGTNLQGMSSDEIKDVGTSLLSCIRAFLMCKDPRTINVSEFELDFDTEDKLLQISNSAQEVIYSTQNVLSSLQRPGLPPINISSEDNAYVVWAVTNDEDYDLTHYLAEGNGTPVSVTEDFVKEIKETRSEIQENLVLRFSTLDNIFWWRISDVKSSLVAVSLVTHSQNKGLSSKVKTLNSPLTVHTNLNSSLLNKRETSGTTFQYNYNTTCSLDLDLAVKVHRLDPAPKSLIKIRFLFPQTNGSLQVRVYRGHRPECDMMKQSVEISEQSPNYPPILVQESEPSFYYIGIIPGRSYVDDTVRYTFEVNTTVCQHWIRGYWSSQGCRIATTKDSQAHCDGAHHLSVFAAGFPVPPQEIDLFSDIELFLTVFDNPLVVACVSVMLLIYLLACLWACLKDGTDKMLKNVVVLNDNFPGDRYPYLLAVYTSSRFNAGTTAHVGIKIVGSLASSRAHILASPERKTLRRNYDDWFLIHYSEPLGELRNIHLWHDNAGSSPDWFCDKIVVYDLRDSLETVFVVEQWLALRINCYPEANVSAASFSQVKNVKRMFLDNCVLGLREDHILLSIMFRHPRSVVSRPQKISSFMCCTMVSMLCSIIFYSPVVDENVYGVGIRDFLISVQSLLISFVTTSFVLFAFKNSYTYVYQNHRSTTLYKTSEFQEYDALRNINTKNTFYASYVRFVSTNLKGRPMVPVQLEKNSCSVRKRRNICFVVAWASCATVIVSSSFFVMLYGLKLGLVKSKMWLSSVLFSMGEELFLVGPLKIIILSFLLSLAFQKVSETSTHRVYIEDALRDKIQVEANDYNKLSSKRNHPMYAPLRHDAVEKMIRKQKLWEKWQTVFDLVISLCFVIDLSMDINELWSSLHYNTHRHVMNTVTQPHHSRRDVEPFDSITDIYKTENYLQMSLFRSLYVTGWYNKNPMIEKGYWMEDFAHRKIGVERLRQIRVASVSCTFKFINWTRRCIPRWDTHQEDTQDYSAGWRSADWNDLKTNGSLWKYTKSSVNMMFTMYRLCGESGTLYHDGGYLTDLGPERANTESKIAETIAYHWQDHLTRAVFVEFTLFNVNSNLFSQVTIIVEYLISGRIQLQTKVMSIQSQIKPSVWSVLLFGFIIYYVGRSGNSINRQGLIEFLMSFRNQTQVLVVVLGTLCFGVAIVHYFSSKAEYNDFIQSGQSVFFDFDSFVYYFLWLKSLSTLLFGLAVLRSAQIFHHGRSLVHYVHTLTLAASWTVCLTVVILLFLLLQAYWMFTLRVYSVPSISEVVIDPMYFVPNGYSDVKTRVFFLVKSLFVSAMVKFYFVFFLHSVRIARTHREKESDRLSLTTSILDNVFRRRNT